MIARKVQSGVIARKVEGGAIARKVEGGGGGGMPLHIHLTEL